MSMKKTVLFLAGALATVGLAGVAGAQSTIAATAAQEATAARTVDLDQSDVLGALALRSSFFSPFSFSPFFFGGLGVPPFPPFPAPYWGAYGYGGYGRPYYGGYGYGAPYGGGYGATAGAGGETQLCEIQPQAQAEAAADNATAGTNATQQYQAQRAVGTDLPPCPPGTTVGLAQTQAQQVLVPYQAAGAPGAGYGGAYGGAYGGGYASPYFGGYGYGRPYYGGYGYPYYGGFY